MCTLNPQIPKGFSSYFCTISLFALEAMIWMPLGMTFCGHKSIFRSSLRKGVILLILIIHWILNVKTWQFIYYRIDKFCFFAVDMYCLGILSMLLNCCSLCFLYSFSISVTGRVKRGHLSKYSIPDVNSIFPLGKVVTAKILR